MKKPIVILLDVDGVLADMKSGYKKIIGKNIDEVEKKDWQKNWDLIVGQNMFETLDQMPDARLLASQLGQMMWTGEIYDVELCTSAGGHRTYAEVARQKLKWFESNSFGFSTMNVTETWQDKVKCMRSPEFEWLLIDDTQRNVDWFRAHGGKAILHTSAKTTLADLNAKRY